jgi:hypothetical protein
MRTSVTRARPQDLGDAIRCVYRLYAESQGKPRYGDKTPAYVHHLVAIGNLLHEAKFIHVVRDGRDVALAMLDVDFGGVNITHAAWIWSQRTARAHHAGLRLGPASYLVVRYEDLVEDSERELFRICDFLALPHDAGMVRYFERPDAVAGGLQGQEHHGHLNLPVTKGLRNWRRQMREVDVARFERVARPMLIELGYEPVTPVPRSGSAGGVVTSLRIAEGRARGRFRARRRASRQG